MTRTDLIETGTGLVADASQRYVLAYEKAGMDDPTPWAVIDTWTGEAVRRVRMWDYGRVIRDRLNGSC